LTTKEVEMTFVLKTEQGLELSTTDEASAFEFARRFATANDTTVSVTRMLVDEDGELLTPLGEPVTVGVSP
jgi:hypothetical protein